MSKAAACNIKIDLSGIERRFSPEQLKAKQEAFACLLYTSRCV